MHSDTAALAPFATASALPLPGFAQQPVQHLLPAHVASSSIAPAAAFSTVHPQHPSILLVDDDAELLAALKSTLEVNGFEVTACASPRAAQRTFAGMKHVDVLITDFQMPDLSGVGLAKRLSAARPSLPVMIVSAASLDRLEREEAERRGWCFLNKPFDVMQLLTALYGLLDGAVAARTGTLTPVLSCVPEAPLSEESLKSAQGGRSSSRDASEGDGNERVLLIGDDSMLLRSRRLLLERAGYGVEEMSSSMARQRGELAGFELVLLCRSVSPGDAVQIAHSLHNRSPRLPVLRFATVGEGVSAQFAATVTSVNSPAFLLTEMERLVSQGR